MEITTKEQTNVTIVSVTGRLDAVSSPELEKKITELINKGQKFLLVNFDGLDYISSAGLRSILAGAKLAKSKQGEIFITGLKGPVEEVFRLTGFQSVFKIFASEEEAFKHIF